MIFKQLIELYDLLDSPSASGAGVVEYLRGIDPACDAETYVLEGPKGSTDMVRVRIPGSRGRAGGGEAPTIGLLGRLGGLGARPERIGFVSDGDGALTALACAAKLLSMHARGDVLPGDVFVSTHVCPHAPTFPHEPVAFMGSPVATADVNREEVGGTQLDAVLVVDTTKGNRIMNERGFMISPTVKQGCIMRVSEDLVSLVEIATGRRARTYPLSMGDRSHPPDRPGRGGVVHDRGGEGVRRRQVRVLRRRRVRPFRRTLRKHDPPARHGRLARRGSGGVSAVRHPEHSTRVVIPSEAPKARMFHVKHFMT